MPRAKPEPTITAREPVSTVRYIVPADRVAREERRGCEQTAFLSHAVTLLGEDVLRAIFHAVIEQSETPFLRLPPQWRAKALAAYRENGQARSPRGEVVCLTSDKSSSRQVRR
jgi:hypothetical protein